VTPTTTAPATTTAPTTTTTAPSTTTTAPTTTTTPAPAAGYAVDSSLAEGQIVRGSITWEAFPQGSSSNRVEFLLDGSLMHVEAQTPYRYSGDSGTLDTGMLTPGKHTVALRADAGDGRTAAWQASIVVEADSVDQPATTTGATTSAPTTTTPTTTTEPAPQQSGNILWRGDYESGGFGGWVPQSSCSPDYTSSQVGEGCASVVRSPVRQGSYAGRFEVRSSGASTDTERADAYTDKASTGGYEGQEWYYAWSTMFPAAGNPNGFSPVNTDFNVFTGWHNADGPCGGNLAFGIDAKSTPEPRIYFMLAARDPSSCGNVTNRQKYYLPLRYDHWYDFIVRVKWSSDPGRGFVEVWADGQAWVPRLAGATMFNANGAYWKQGFYRASWDGGTNTAIHDGARRGDSLAAVQ